MKSPNGRQAEKRRSVGRLLTACLALSRWFLFCATPLAVADELRSTAAHRISGRIRIDGLLDERAWREIPDIGEFVQAIPHSGEKPTEATEVRIAYTNETLYIAIRCHDHRPGQIVATEMGRDAVLTANDNVEIVLDTYHDRHNAYYFSTNPLGALVDGRVTESQYPDLNWDGIWNVRTHVDEGGWTAEFEIPFKTLGFDAKNHTWGLNVSRYLARLQEFSRWTSASFDAQLYQMGRAGELTGLEGLSQGLGLDVKPYGVTGFARDTIINEPLGGTYTGGGDISYRITSNLVSNTTFNTDFTETQADAMQVNLTPYSLYYPEKRAFFLEDASMFQFGGLGAPQVGGPGGGAPPPNGAPGGPPPDFLPFYSRMIGLPDGLEVPIHFGEKLTGKIGRFDVGLVDVETGNLRQDGRTVAEGTNLAVARVKYNFWRQSYIGAMFTDGDPLGETHNQMEGIDLKLATSDILNTDKNLSLTLFGSKTQTSGVTGQNASYGGELTYPNDLITFDSKWYVIGQNYDPLLGFVNRRGVRDSTTMLQFGPRPRFWNIRQMLFMASYTNYYSLVHRATETTVLQLSPLQWTFNSGESIGYMYMVNYDALFQPWAINPGTNLPVGGYHYGSHNFNAGSSPTRPLSFNLGYSFGPFYGGTNRQATFGITWKTDTHLSTSVTLQENWIALPEGRFNTSLAMLNLSYSFTNHISLANLVQYNSQSRSIGLQSRLRWILRPGTELWVVLNDNYIENQFDRFASAQTSLRIKFDHTFRF